MENAPNPQKHHNNTKVPEETTDITLETLAGHRQIITLEQLMRDYPVSVMPAYSYVTNHGIHGPYRLEGVQLLDLLKQRISGSWTGVEVLSADGFGNYVHKEELEQAQEPIMLYFKINGEILKKKQGLVRLLVPSETDNALRQIKWVKRLRLE